MCPTGLGVLCDVLSSKTAERCSWARGSPEARYLGSQGRGIGEQETSLSSSHFEGRGWQVRGALSEAGSQVLDYITKCDLAQGHELKKLKTDSRDQQ